MAINFPNDRKTVVDRIKTDVQSSLPNSQPFLNNSYIGSLITGFGGRIFDNYEQLKEILKQMFPDTATGDFLKRWGAWVGKNPNGASQSQGPIVVTGTAATILPINDQFNSASGQQYITLEEAELAAISISVPSLTRSGSLVTGTTASNHGFATGMQVVISGADQAEYNGTFTIIAISLTQFTYTISATPSTPATGAIFAGYTGASVNVKSVSFGSNTNQPSGAQLSIATPISGINTTAIVQFSEISGGADAEDEEDYRNRVEFRYQNPHASFNAAEIESKAKEVPGVTKVWVFKITPVIGDVTIYFIRGNDESIIPDPSEVAKVLSQILTIIPAHTEEDQVHVEAPTPVPVDFTFSALNPDTSTMRDAIEANLTFFFREGVDVSQNLVSDAYRSVIYQTIDATGAQVISFTLISPPGDVSIAAGELPVLGDINFP